MNDYISMKFSEWLGNKPIKSKLMWMMMVVATTTLFSVAIIFAFYNVSMVRDAIHQELKLVANIIGKRSIPSLEFNLKEQAQSHLLDLQTKPSIELACLYTSEGKILAKYTNSNQAICPPVSKRSLRVHKGYITGHIALHKLIHSSNNEAIGTLYLQSNLSQLKEHLTIIFPFTAIIFSAILGIAFFLSRQLRSVISTPIQSLTETAKHIKEYSEYQISAIKYYDDEVGSLATAFNAMLEEIHKSHIKLKSANRDLEDQVQERTEHLERTLDSLQVALDAKKHFLNNMSHELRTPNHHLKTLSGYILKEIDILKEQADEYIKESPDGQLLEQYNKVITKLDRYSGQLYSACNRESTLISNMNDLDAMSTDRKDFHIEENDLSALLPGWLSAYRNNRTDYHPSASALTALFDKNQIKKVVDYILSNAFVYAPEGRITVTVEKKLYKGKEGNTLQGIKCSIADEGIGIPEDELEFIFETFGESSFTKTAAGGRGIGLSICREIIKAHNGIIWAENNDNGSGAVFHFILPAE